MNDLNEEQAGQGRVILATLIIIAIWIGWRFIFPTPEPVNSPVADAVSESAVPFVVSPAPVASLAADRTGDSVSDGASDASSDVAVEKIVRQPEERFISFKHGDSDILLSSKTAAFSKWELKKFTLRDGEAENEDGQTELGHVSMVATSQLRLDLGDSINMPEYYEIISDDGHQVVLSGKSQQVKVDITYTQQDEYIMDAEVLVTNLTPFGTKFSPRVTVQGSESKNEGSFFAPAYDMLRFKCLVDGDLEDAVTKKMKKSEDYTGKVAWVGADRQYFLAAVGPRPQNGQAAAVPGTCHFNVKDNDDFAEASYIMAAQNLPANGTATLSYRAFIGPKMQDSFDKAQMALDESVDYVLWGIPLAFLAKPMLWLMGIFFDWTGSYGLAIIFLTLVVKLILLPVNHKSMVSMRNMQKLQPKMEEIKRKYPNDQEAQTREMMKFYQQEHINPAGGCLPMFLQMPILCALYRAIGAAVELYQQPFLWINDLSLAEPIPFMAIAMGLIMILQQKLTTGANKSMDAQQQTQMKIMMYGMPIFMTVIMMALPSGLVLYTLVNVILSIFHQLYINKKYKAA